MSLVVVSGPHCLTYLANLVHGHMIHEEKDAVEGQNVEKVHWHVPPLVDLVLRRQPSEHTHEEERYVPVCVRKSTSLLHFVEAQLPVNYSSGGGWYPTVKQVRSNQSCWATELLNEEASVEKAWKVRPEKQAIFKA